MLPVFAQPQVAIQQLPLHPPNLSGGGQSEKGRVEKGRGTEFCVEEHGEGLALCMCVQGT